jgi:hypothetical protein
MRALALVAAPALAAAWAQAPPKPPVIVNATLQQYEDGPTLPAGHQFIPGETVFFSFQVRGYSVSPEGKVQLSYRIEAQDADGAPLAEADTGSIETEISDLDKDWLPRVRYSCLIPPHALPGKFRITAVVRDGRTALEARQEAAFTVQGRAVDVSGPFSVRNIRFLRSEEDRAPLAVASYRPGDTLWARFDITGFKLGDKNHVEVVYGISIVSPSGKVLYSEPEAASEEDASFYPRRYVPGVASLNVQPKTTPGEYTLLITARDLVGHQTCEGRGVFRIEQ